jgi:hypothetical protein
VQARLCRLSCRAYVEFVLREGAHHKTFVHDVKENSLLQELLLHTVCKDTARGK